MTQPITLPTIHLNGTGAKSLRDEYNKVRLAAKATADALASATCRDLQVLTGTRRHLPKQQLLAIAVGAA